MPRPLQLTFDLESGVRVTCDVGNTSVPILVFLGLSVLDLGRVIFVGGSQRTSPSLDLTFPPTGLSKNLGEWKGGGEGKEKGKGGEITCLTSPHWLLPQIPPWT